MEFERGSEWRRWELHIHTPGTVKNDCFRGSSLEEKWNNYYEDITSYIGDGNNLTKNIAVIAITDYLSIDNYKRVIADNRLPSTIALVLPNVEMRIQPIANDSPINIHFIFNPEIIENIEDRFFSKLSFSYGSTTFSASHSELIRLGKTINDSLDNDKAYIKGIEQYVPSFDSIKSVFDADLELRDNTIILVSNSSTDGVSGVANHSDYLCGEHGDSQLKAFRQSVYNFVDGIFSSSPSDIKYFLGKKDTCPAEMVIKDCGSLKPCVHGSDAHTNQKIFEPDRKRYCWIKADPTFNGLKQILYEPEERVKISESIPNYKQEYYVIDSIKFDDTDFQPNEIHFNENLTCVIGGKSTGKSILLHNLAMAIDKEQVKQKENVSKTSTKNVNESIVLWADGKSDEKRKIIYIPQAYLNRLSDEQEDTNEIDEIIQDIVLLDDNSRIAYSNMGEAIKSYKSNIQKIILELLSNHSDILSLKNTKGEIGSHTGIEKEINKLKEQKEELTKELALSLEDMKKYENAVQNINLFNKKISVIKNEISYIEKLDSIVAEKEIPFAFIDETQQMLDISIKSVISVADDAWKTEKDKIISQLKQQLTELEVNLNENIKIELSLKDQVQENKTITELTEKIQKENEKLNRILAIESKEDILQEMQKVNIHSLCSSINVFKELHTIYANTINSDSKYSNSELEFSVSVPFRKEAFISKVGDLFNNRSVKYKSIFSDDDLSEDNYNYDFLKEIIIRLLDGTLQPKGSNTIESIMRELLGDWFGIKYNVKMDADTINVMSPGKKALVLLKLLIDLAESKCPILIDQPEDDLDNRSIFEDLIPFIKKKKQDRQIIIVTHNANVVLGADAEEVIVANQQGSNSPNKEYRFEYRSGSIENNLSIYDNNGNIENGVLSSQGIQQHICDILEGGEKAFELRKKKYHI